jgi:YbbR domain-containing protein
VEVNYSGSLPDGYELATNETEVEPGFVIVTGTAAQLASIVSVDLDVNLDGRRDEQSSFEGDLVARSSSGAVDVRIDPPRAKVTMAIRQTFSQRQLPVVAPITGHPAAGYEIVRTVYEPSTVVVSGLKSVMDDLSEIVVDAVDVGGAATNVTQTRQIRIPNTSVQPTTVVVRVEIRPVECVLNQQSRGCATRTFAVAVTLSAPPSGLTYSPGTYMTQVRVTGPLAALNELSAADFAASASLATGVAGTASYPVAVVGPQGIRVDSADPVNVTLTPAP